MTAMTWACALECNVCVKHELDLTKMKVGACFYTILGSTPTRRHVRDAFIDRNDSNDVIFQT